MRAQNDTQQKIQAIWSDLLRLKEIGMQDDFFSLGGHSLLMIQLVSRLRQAFDFSIPLSAVVDTRTIAGQATRIDTLLWSRNTSRPDNASFKSQTVREEVEV